MRPDPADDPGDGVSTPRILAIANRKGGVGKTTTAINLGTALALGGERVLIIDLDPQGNASTGLGIARSDRAIGSYAMLAGEVDLLAAARDTGVPGLAIVAADAELAGAEIELVAASRREFRLRDAFAALPTVSPPFGHIIIDCPPSLGLLTVNALVAAGSVLVPLQCEFFALEGLSQLLRAIGLIRGRLNPDLDINGILLTMHDRRNNLSELVAADVRSHFGEQVYGTIIPRNVRISEAPSHGKPVLLYDIRSPGSQAYVQLAAEFRRRAYDTRGRREAVPPHSRAAGTVLPDGGSPL